MTYQFDKKTNKKLGKKTQLANLEESGLQGEIYTNINKQILIDTKKPRKPPEKLKTEVIRIRVSTNELLKIQAYADGKESTVSQIIREYIRRLPSVD